MCIYMYIYELYIYMLCDSRNKEVCVSLRCLPAPCRIFC